MAGSSGLGAAKSRAKVFSSAWRSARILVLTSRVVEVVGADVVVVRAVLATFPDPPHAAVTRASAPARAARRRRLGVTGFRLPLEERFDVGQPIPLVSPRSPEHRQPSRAPPEIGRAHV